MIVRRASAADHPAWGAMRQRLWPDSEPDELKREPPATAFVAEEKGRLVVFGKPLR
jgi:hypothetical protein